MPRRASSGAVQGEEPGATSSSVSGSTGTSNASPPPSAKDAVTLRGEESTALAIQHRAGTRTAAARPAAIGASQGEKFIAIGFSSALRPSDARAGNPYHSTSFRYVTVLRGIVDVLSNHETRHCLFASSRHTSYPVNRGISLP
jgi:hypothetical protein